MRNDDKGLSKEMVQHLDTREERDAFKQQIANASPVLNKYREIIEKRIKKKEDTKEIDYDCSSWSHKQADDNGYIRAMNEILRLIPRP